MVSTGNVNKWHESEDALKLGKMASMPEIDNSLRALVFSAISLSWAAFEVLSNDLWIAA